MGKKKVGKEEQEKRDQIREDHERYKKNLEDARSNREFVMASLTDSRFVKILSRFEKDIEDEKERLVTTEKKDIERKQAEILARRCLLSTLRGAYENDVDEAQRNLREFESHNQLFIVPEGAKDEVQEAAAAG